MKGLRLNQDTFSEKGSPASEGRYMFSVGGLVAFWSHWSMAPMASSHYRGSDILKEEYFLQEEIPLEEWDRTNYRSRPTGHYDIQKIENLQDRFLHELDSSCSWESGWFIVGIQNHSNQLLKVKNRIEEIRKHPGLFLHVYSIPAGYYYMLTKESIISFESAIQRFLELQDETRQIRDVTLSDKYFSAEGMKMALRAMKASYREDSFGCPSKKLTMMAKILEHIDALNEMRAVCIVKNYNPREDSYRFITSDQVAAHGLSLGTDDGCGGVCRDEEMTIYHIAKKIEVKGRIYCGSLPYKTPVDIFIEDGRFVITDNLWISWANREYAEESRHIDLSFYRYDLPSGEESEFEEINARVAERKQANKANYDAALQNCRQSGLTDQAIKELVNISKGRIASSLNIAAEMKKMDRSLAQIKECLMALGGRNSVVLNVATLLSKRYMNFEIRRIRKVVPRCTAKKYLADTLPDSEEMVGNFEDKMAAFKAYLEIIAA